MLRARPVGLRRAVRVPSVRMTVVINPWSRKCGLVWQLGLPGLLLVKST